MVDPTWIRSILIHLYQIQGEFSELCIPLCGKVNVTGEGSAKGRMTGITSIVPLWLKYVCAMHYVKKLSICLSRCCFQPWSSIHCVSWLHDVWKWIFTFHTYNSFQTALSRIQYVLKDWTTFDWCCCGKLCQRKLHPPWHSKKTYCKFDDRVVVAKLQNSVPLD